MARRSRIPQYGTVEINGIQYYKTYVEDAEGKRIAIYGQKQVKIELSQFLNFAVWISCSRK